MDQTPVKILLITDLTSAYSRSLLRGIVRYAKSKGNWTFLRMPLSYKMMHGDEEIIRCARKWKVNAIVAQINNVDVVKLRSLNIPIIVQNYGDRIAGVCNLTGDYVGTGEMAADYFMSLGYSSFAFYGVKETIWSRERYAGFRNRLSAAGYHIQSFFEQIPNYDSWSLDNDKMVAWLRQLPPKTALFACDDYYALIVSDACRSHDIRIPEDIAILGVDNDEMICNISTPPLSSIIIDAEDGGYKAGTMLENMIEGQISYPANIIVPPVHVITRGSTSSYAMKDKYIMQVVEYIANNYNSEISVPDLLELIPMSRRQFEIKFKENTGMSVYRYILNYRVDKLAEKLLSSDRKIEDLAVDCGFFDSKNVSRTFQKIKGMTPSEFRAKGKSEEAD